MLLKDAAHQYVGLVDGTKAYLDQFRFTIHALEKFVGHKLHVEELTADIVNGYLIAMKDKLGHRTRRSRRNMLRRLYCHVTGEDLTKLVKIKVSDAMVQAWTIDEVRRLLATARKMRGKYRLTGPMKRHYWEAYIMAGWDTGWSGCDLRTLNMATLHPETGMIGILRRKTQRPVISKLRPKTIEAIKRLGDKQQPLKSWCGLSVWRRLAQRLVDCAGLEGSIGQLRHSAGTAVEIQFPQKGYQFLGNTPEVFFRHYFDRRLNPNIPQPPELDEAEAAVPLTLVG